MNIDLDNFLSDYKPKNLKKQLSRYLSRKKLKNYSLYENDYDNLILYDTYIRYIYIEQAFQDKKLDKHIKCGGILLKGGIYKKNNFVETEPQDWKYLMLKYDPDNNIKKQHSLNNPITYVICISKCYIFYKKIKRKNDYFKNMIIELV